jgi:signal transduction histidine kinase
VFFRSPMSRPSRGGTTPLTVVLLLTVSLSLWLGYEAFASARDHRAAVEATLRDYTGMAAWELSRLSRESINWFVDEAFDDLRDRRGMLRPAGSLVREMNEEVDHLERRGCDCDALRQPLLQLRIDYPSRRFTLVPDSMGSDRAERLVSAVEQRITGEPPTRSGFIMAGPGEILDRPVGIGYAARGHEGDDEQAAYAFVITVEAVGQLIEHWYRRHPLLPPSEGRAAVNDSLLHGRVTGPGGLPVFTAAGTADSGLASRDTVAATWGGLVAHVDVRPDAASKLVAGGMPPPRTPLFLGMLALVVVAGATGLVLIRREEELARLRDDFVSGVSHELRTPLAQIRMFAELQGAGKLRTEDDRRRAISVIDREARRLSLLVENVLQFTRLRRAPDPVRGMGGLDIDQAVSEAIEGFRPLLDASNMSVRVELEPGLRGEFGSGMFRQILVNFLDNAVKYGPPGQTVTVRAEQAERGLRITVDDEGPGVPPPERRRIWRPYRRLARDIRSRHPGTGVGLAVVAALAKQHGGHAWVDDAPGGGARFCVELPGGKQPAPTHAPAEVPA